MDPWIHPWIHGSMDPSIDPSIHRSIDPSIHPSIHPSIRSIDRPIDRPTHPSIHRSVGPSNPPLATRLLLHTTYPHLQPRAEASLPLLPRLMPVTSTQIRQKTTQTPQLSTITLSTKLPTSLPKLTPLNSCITETFGTCTTKIA